MREMHLSLSATKKDASVAARPFFAPDSPVAGVTAGLAGL